MMAIFGEFEIQKDDLTPQETENVKLTLEQFGKSERKILEDHPEHQHENSEYHAFGCHLSLE